MKITYWAFKVPLTLFLISCLCSTALAQYQAPAIRALLSVFAELFSVSLPLRASGRTAAKISVSSSKVVLNVEREVGRSGLKISAAIPLSDFQATAKAAYVSLNGKEPPARFDEKSGIFIVVVHKGERTVFVVNADPICVANIAEPALFTISISGRYVEVPVSRSVSDIVFGTSKEACDSIRRDLDSKKVVEPLAPTREISEPTSLQELIQNIPMDARAGLFVGQWRNENRATEGITRLRISQRLDNLILEGWGSCSPTDCVWGSFAEVTTVNASNLRFKTVWRLDYADKEFSFRLLSRSRLEVITRTVFKDNSGRSSSTSLDYLERTAYSQ